MADGSKRQYFCHLCEEESELKNPECDNCQIIDHFGKHQSKAVTLWPGALIMLLMALLALKAYLSGVPSGPSFNRPGQVKPSSYWLALIVSPFLAIGMFYKIYRYGRNIRRKREAIRQKAMEKLK